MKRVFKRALHLPASGKETFFLLGATAGGQDAQLSYWRLASGIEVDFVVDDMRLAIEAKAAAKVTADHLWGLRALVQDHPRAKRRLVVCLEPKSRRTEDGIEVLPVREFCQQLAAGDVL